MWWTKCFLLLFSDLFLKLLQEIVRRETPDEEIRAAFTSMKEEGKLVPCNVSVAKLLKILSQRKFKSGDHVDYYDE